MKSSVDLDALIDGYAATIADNFNLLDGEAVNVKRFLIQLCAESTFKYAEATASLQARLGEARAELEIIYRAIGLTAPTDCTSEPKHKWFSKEYGSCAPVPAQFVILLREDRDRLQSELATLKALSIPE